MAYADEKTRPNRASIGGTLFVNGLMVTGIILAVPDVSPIKIIHTTLIPILTPKTPTPTKPTVKHQAPSAKPTPTPPSPQPAGSRLTNAGTTSTLSAGEGTGIAVLPELPPLAPIHDSVFSAARINPGYTNALQPLYPPGMIRAEMEGFATVRVLIGTDGRVKQVEAVKASDTAFLDATRKQALSKWRFLPATRDGEPVESWREMTVRFQLPD